MLAAVLLAATLPLGVWPVDAGAAATVVDDIELYVVEPEDDYFILAVEPLSPSLAKPEPAALERLTALAHKLGADGIVLLSELAEKDIPEDSEEALPQAGRFSAAVFVAFDTVTDEKQGPALTRARGRHAARAVAARGPRPGAKGRRPGHASPTGASTAER
jgi:hypothetical protein